MSQFKVGDLALVIKSTESEDIGKSVSIEELYTDDGENDHVFGDVSFEADTPGEKCAVVLCAKNGIEAYSVDSLMPLRGDFQPERQKSQELPA